MKKLIKISSYALATVIAFVISLGSAFAAGNTPENASLNSGEVVGGISILLLAILLPTIQRERKAEIKN
jgi:ethanolamine transporter EutH